MLVPRWSQGNWERQTPAWERHPAGSCCWDTAACTSQPRFAAAWRDPWGDTHLCPENCFPPPLPSCYSLGSLLPLWEMKTTPDGGDGQPGQSPAYTRTLCWMMGFLHRGSLYQDSLCKTPIIQHRSGPPSLLPGADRAGTRL